MSIPYFLLWIFYFILTLDERNEYLQAQSKNMDCVNSHNGMFTSTYEFDPNKKPVRRYSTWSEFWSQRGY